MEIADDWTIEDRVSGLRIRVEVGKKLNRLHIERMSAHVADNRDFFFAKDGEFDGTGSSCEE